MTLKEYLAPEVVMGGPSYPGSQQFHPNLMTNLPEPFKDGQMHRTATVQPEDRDYIATAPRTLLEQARNASEYFPWRIQSLNSYLRLTEDVHTMVNNALEGGRVHKAALIEAISYDDFNYIMQDTLYRQMLDRWAVPDSPFEAFSREIKIPTLQRPGKLFTLDGIEKPIGLVHPGQMPEVRHPYDSGLVIRPYKYMADIELLWETLIEDDLNALGRLPQMLDTAIKVSMARIFTQTYAKNTGFNDGTGEIFNATNNDKITNPTLSATTAMLVENTLKANTNFGVSDNDNFSLTALQAAQTQMSL